MNDLAEFIAFVVHVLFGLGLLADVEARRRRKLTAGFVSGVGGFAETQVGRFLAVALYEMVHDSTLVSQRPYAQT